LWRAESEPQKLAIATEADETLYGGAAGGGKSALLLILATTEHRDSIIFRRTYPNLKEMIKTSKRVLKGIARYNSVDKLWSEIPGDRTIEFGAMLRDDDWEDYRGRPHDLKAYDELTEMTEEQYVNTSGWCRTTIPGQRCRIVGTCNPPSNRQGRWIIKRWAPWLDPKHPNPAEPGELRWFASIDGVDTEVDSGEPFVHNEEEIIPRSRTFIPARLDDNTYISGSGYRAVLQGLPEPLRSQLLYGDFTIGEKDGAWQVIPSKWLRNREGTGAMDRWQDRSKFGYDTLGVDVARGGEARTVIAPRYRYWIDKLIVFPGQDTPDGDVVAQQILQVMPNTECTVNIDILGPGCSPYDTLKRTGVKNLRGINGGQQAVVGRDGEILRDRTKKLGFRNVRSYVYWHLRELLDPVYGQLIELPNDDDLYGELTSIDYEIIPLREQDDGMIGVIAIEPKEDVIAKLGASPDLADPVAYAFADDLPFDTESDAHWILNLGRSNPFEGLQF
jgi:hypothetical protein